MGHLFFISRCLEAFASLCQENSRIYRWIHRVRYCSETQKGRFSQDFLLPLGGKDFRHREREGLVEEAFKAGPGHGSSLGKLGRVVSEPRNAK